MAYIEKELTLKLIKGSMAIPEQYRNMLYRGIEVLPEASIQEVKACDDCRYTDVPMGHLPCTECSNYYTSKFEMKSK